MPVRLTESAAYAILAAKILCLQGHSEKEGFYVMYEQFAPTQPTQLPSDENKVAGTVGAFLFALVGGLAFYLLYQVGKLAAISGIIGVSCALVGYRLFAKRESRYGTVIAVVMAALVIVLAWYLCLAQDVYEAYKEWYESGDIDYQVGYFTAVRYAYRFLEEPDIARGYLTDLVIGLLLCVAGWIGTFVRSSKRAKTQPAVQPAQPVYAQPVAPTEAAAPVPPQPETESAAAPVALNGEETAQL